MVQCAKCISNSNEIKDTGGYVYTLGDASSWRLAKSIVKPGFVALELVNNEAYIEGNGIKARGV